MTTETTLSNPDTSLTDMATALFGNGEPANEAATEEAAETEEPQETAEDTQAEEAASDDDSGDEEETPKPKKRTTADRIKKLAMDRSRQAQEIEQLRKELEAIKTGKPLTEDKPAATADTGLVKPDPAKYQYGELDPKFIEDLADYRADLKLAKFQAELRQQQEQERQQEAERRASATLQEKATAIEQAGSSKYADFHEVVVEGGQNGDYPLTKEMFELAVEMGERAPDVLYHLATNPEEAAKVAKMSLPQQAMWFGRMEAKLATPPARKATAAPPPPSASPRGAGSKGGVALDDLNDPRALKAMAKALFA